MRRDSRRDIRKGRGQAEGRGEEGGMERERESKFVPLWMGYQSRLVTFSANSGKFG